MRPEPNLAPSLLEFSDEYGALMRRIETAASGHGTGISEGRVLRTLRRGPMAAALISRELQMDSGQLSRTIKNLSDKGLVAGSESPSKVKPLKLTDAGQDKADEVSRRQAIAAGEVWRELDTPAKQRFLASAQQLEHHLYESGEAAIQIRDAAPGESGILVRGAVESFTGGYYGYDQTLEAACLDIFARVLAGNNIVMVVERYRALVGGLAISIDRADLSARIEYFAMFRWEQGHGWGTQLLEAARSRAGAIGLRRLIIECPVDRDGDSYFGSRGEEWKRLGVRKQTWCGCKRDWESWTRKV